MEATEINAVNAVYETIGTFKNVLIKTPALNDHYLNEINAHTITTKSGQHHIASHFRRGDYIDGQLVTRHFFVDLRNLGQTIIADKVEIVKKTDYYRNGVVTFIINIYKFKPEEKLLPKFRLKIGSPSGEKKFQIPGTVKFIKLEVI